MHAKFCKREIRESLCARKLQNTIETIENNRTSGRFAKVCVREIAKNRIIRESLCTRKMEFLHSRKFMFAKVYARESFCSRKFLDKVSTNSDIIIGMWNIMIGHAFYRFYLLMILKVNEIKNVLL